MEEVDRRTDQEREAEKGVGDHLMDFVGGIFEEQESSFSENFVDNSDEHVDNFKKHIQDPTTDKAEADFNKFTDEGKEKVDSFLDDFHEN